MSIRTTGIALAAFAALTGWAQSAHAQTNNQIIYDDSLESGWQNYGWATLNYGSTAIVQSGSKSISVTAGAYQALYLHHTALDSSAYTAITFWINGGAVGGQSLAVRATLNGSPQASVPIAPLAANTWTQVTIPLTALGADNHLTLDGFWITDVTGHAQSTFYVDTMALVAPNTPPRTDAALTVNSATPIRVLDSRLYGINTTVWDGNMGSSSTQSALTAASNSVLRFPGGSTSDGYNWSTGKSDGNGNQWASTFSTFAKLAETTSAQSYITVNYGSGSPQMAAAWVAYANGSASSTAALGTDVNGVNWKTVSYWAALRGASPLATDDGYNFLRVSHPASYHMKYWEIGNECFGSWENDKHGVSGSMLSGTAHDAYTYATWAAQFLSQMRAVDPTIKIGAVVLPGEDSSPGAHSAINPNEGNSAHYGWTPVVLAYLKSVNAFPDFLIHHSYAQSPGGESDDALLIGASAWSADAASLRKMLTDYVGAGSNAIELAATETNSVAYSPGKQSVSLVNGLFLANNLAQIAQTEFNSCIWWNLHNASETSHNNSTSLYGWRNFGDYGVLAIGDRSDTPVNTPYPAYRAMELLSHWGRGGDTLVTGSSDNNKLAIYATMLKTGGLALLVINKSSASDLTGHLNLGNFAPASAPADVYQYGKPEDAAIAGLTHTTFTVPGAAFDYVFPAYSMTVMTIAPATTVKPSVTQTLTPTDDTYVNGASASATNHGYENLIIVKRDAVNPSPYRRTIYLKFDLTGLKGAIGSAKLALILSNTSGAAVPLSVYGIGDTSWTESTLTWNSALAAGGLTADSLSTGTLAATTLSPVSPGVCTWDVSGYLQNKAGQIVTLQVCDPGTDGSFFCFNSKEAASGKPTLTIQQ